MATASRTRARLTAVAAIVGLAVSGGVIAATSSASAVSADCALLTSPLYGRYNPTSRTGLVTAYPTEATNSVTWGFTVDRGVLGKGATEQGGGLVGVHRMYSATANDFLYTTKATEVTRAQGLGYVDQGVFLYASPNLLSCTVPVYRFLKGAKHQVLSDPAQMAAATADGWTREGELFFAAPADGAVTPAPAPAPAPAANPLTVTSPLWTGADSDTQFTIAAIPDTQYEVHSWSDTRFANRTQWLIDNKANLDLRYVTSSGDVTDWGWTDRQQFDIANAALSKLDGANIPWLAVPGNHDSAAVCAGGGACAGQDASVGLRNTSVFNQYFPTTRVKGLQGTYEAGKVDNAYTAFRAGGVNWLVLNLELWPRAGAVAWADKVIKANPKANVIINTHDYLLPNGSITGWNGGYGSQTTSYIFDNLVRPNANVKLVLSGHEWDAGQSESWTDAGTKVGNYMQTYHSSSTNPVRLLTIDTANGSVTSRSYAPYTNQTYGQYDGTLWGMSFVR